MASDDSISIRESPCWLQHGLVGFGRKEPEAVLAKSPVRAREQGRCGEMDLPKEVEVLRSLQKRRSPRER
jgi:hypothetical protein